MIMQPNQILILGGGVAGLSSAIALGRRFPSAKLTIIDKALTSQRDPGFGMLLMINGVKALQDLGASEILQDFQPIKRSLIKAKNGEVVFDETFGEGQIYCCSREKLIAGLEAAFQRNVPTFEQLHKRCVAVDVSATGFVTKITMSDKTDLCVGPEDLIVAADGVHSVLCSTLNSGMDRPVSTVNELVSSIYAPELAEQIGNTFHKTVMCAEGLGFGLVAPTATHVIGFIQFDTSKHTIPKSTEERRALYNLAVSKIDACNPHKEFFAKYASIVDVVGASHIWKPINCELPSKLHVKNAVLVGDAAHPLLPFTSQGVAAALEDALALADALAPEATIESSLINFERVRRPIVNEYLQGGKRILKDFLQPDGSITLQPYCEGRRQEAKAPETTTLFTNDQVDFKQLSKKAYNYRWATLGEGIIPLTAADSDFPIAQPIREAMHEYIEDGYMNYGPATGLPELKEEIADKHDCDADQVFITNAAASSMFLVAQQLVKDPNDEVLLADPIDFLFQRAVEQAGGVVKRYAIHAPDKHNPNSHWSFDIQDLKRLITPKTRVLAICNPHNPIGRVWNRKELEALTDLAIEYNLKIWSDEVWSDIAYNGDFIPTASLGRDVAALTYTVLGFSKGYGLAGLRLGAIIAPQARDVEEISKRSLADDTGYGVSVLSQVAGLAALKQAGYWQRAFVNHVRGQCQRSVDRLNKMPAVHATMPQGTFVVFANVSSYLEKSGMNEEELVEYLKVETKVALVPGSPRFFGPSAAGHIRISVATSEAVLEEALNRLEKGLATLLLRCNHLPESKSTVAEEMVLPRKLLNTVILQNQQFRGAVKPPCARRAASLGCPASSHRS
ncbi:Bifunctional aspartate aminotransferase and glutamate/aspartate-prephenate aminotransferase [Seminavis robusta]|uniref:Bifunctional aspartate aminotransferase and glutamate/aspartate-prephenate aminotransferase n=1 Tax=Seminavis robusta TaxID=568900 RepID=A0A9N8HUW3_9STRA|nr:Bifunctional aspartate aminotransferase and glutamate/aspartate-prephenate aminotransferase [Seminavis robusta]|eukprot:Sro1888_g303610.1 Bifunctional aspartate aminotransferase and glutamate/aspartate-prephenate aminotransferase (846) ;mRNA; r:3823-6360